MIQIAWWSIRNRGVSVGLATLAIALGVALYLGIERVRASAQDSFAASISGVDMIVGARGGDVQILLYSVFNIGNATVNITADSLTALADFDHVDWVAPISLGDNHRGFRVVGTTNAFFDNVKMRGRADLRFREGGPLEGVFGAVLGAQVARELGYGLGREIIVSHGLVSAGNAEHDNLPFFVAGILEPTGSPIDRNVYVSIEGITAIHLDWRAGARIPGVVITPEDVARADLAPSSVTAVLLGVSDRRRIFQVQRTINEYRAEPLTAILPGVALSNLWAVMAVVEQSFAYISLAAFAVAILGLVALLNMSLAQRRREMAIYRSLGARPWQVAALLLVEAFLIGLAAITVGMCLTVVVERIVGQFAMTYASVSLQFGPLGVSEGVALLALLGATLAAGLVPAIRLYRQSLSQALTITE